MIIQSISQSYQHDLSKDIREVCKEFGIAHTYNSKQLCADTLIIEDSIDYNKILKLINIHRLKSIIFVNENINKPLLISILRKERNLVLFNKIKKILSNTYIEVVYQNEKLSNKYRSIYPILEMSENINLNILNESTKKIELLKIFHNLNYINHGEFPTTDNQPK